MDGTLKWSRRRTVVVQGERHGRNLAIKIEKAVGAAPFGFSLVPFLHFC